MPSRMVWLQSPPWSGVWTRQNHFARRFVRDGGEVLYVENPVAVATRLRARHAGSTGGDPVREVEPGIRVLELPLQLPGGTRSGVIGLVNGARFARHIKRALSDLGWRDYAAWCRLPQSVYVLKHLSPSWVIYDVTDDYEFYARSGRERALTRQLESALARRADRIITTTQALSDRLRNLNPAVAVVPNGVDPQFFDPVPTNSDPIADVPKPRIGYVGIVARWMDFELLEKLAARWPGRIVIVGPIKPEVHARFQSIAGLIHINQIPYFEVPRYLNAFDVCILPHEISELRHRADPLKIVEYLASGRPVISVALRSVETFHPLVETASTHAEFLNLVESRLTDPQPQLIESRKALARVRDWDTLYAKVASEVFQPISMVGEGS